MTLTVVVSWPVTAGEPPPGLLTARERSEAALRSPWRARDFTRGRLAAKVALALAGEQSNIEILCDASGAPVGPPSWHLSISHTVDAVAVTVAKGPCGVDAERADRDLRVLLPHITGPLDAVEGLSPVTVLTCKEAGLKAMRGKPIGLKNYPLRQSSSGLRVRGMAAHLHQTGPWLVVTVAAQRPVMHELLATEVIQRCAHLAI